MDINFLANELKNLSDEFDNSHIHDWPAHNRIWQDMINLLVQNKEQTIYYLANCEDICVLQNIACVLPDTNFELQSNELVKAVERIYLKYSQYLDSNLVERCQDSLLDPIKDADMLLIWQKHKNISWWRERNKLIENQKEKIGSKISTLRELSTRRPLLAREQTELVFLEKIQAADSFDALDALNKELTNTATDPELKARLQKYVVDKMDFY